ncbi:MAG: hypothetical protein MUC95_09850, partial [Spirochaetes bacterium]|nr:hypothetical protein [Spirochaetota bacterium]
TTNGGASWTASNTGISGFGIYVFSLVFNPSHPGNLYAGTLGGVYRSTNTGQVWTRVNTGLTDSFFKID